MTTMQNRLFSISVVTALFVALLLSLGVSGAFAFEENTGSDAEGNSNSDVWVPKVPKKTTNPKPNTSAGAGGGIGGSTPKPSISVSSQSTWNAGTARSWGCTGVNSNGSPAMGAVRTVRFLADGVGWNAMLPGIVGQILKQTVSCKYPPSWSETSLSCVVSSTGNISKVSGTPIRLLNIYQATAYSTNRTVDNCRNSAQWINVSGTPNVYGHWEAQGSTIVEKCMWRTYTSADPRTGVTPAAELRNCYTVNNYNAFYAKGTLTCKGWTDGVHLQGYSFTENDCLDATTPNSLQCVVGGAPLIDWNGQSYRGTSVETLRNGGDVRMRWDTPTITGSGLQSIVATRSRLAVANAPWSNQFSLTNNWFGLQKTGSSQNALKDTAGTPWGTGLQTDWTAQWYQPTSSPTTFGPQYEYDADFLKQTVRITGVHPNGSWRTEVVNTTVRSKAACSAPVLGVSALRVVNGVS